MFCGNCGKEIKQGAKFCVYCGTPVPAAFPPGVGWGTPPPAGRVAPPSPPGPGSAASAHGHGPARPPAPPTPQQNKSALIWLLVIVGIAVISIIVLIVLFLIASEGTKKGRGLEGTVAGGSSEEDAREAEATVRSFSQALAAGDVDALIEAMEPDYVAAVENALGRDYREMLSEYYHHVLFWNLELEVGESDVEVSGDRATVTVVEGALSHANDGETIGVDASEGGTEPLRLVKRGGKWYITSETLARLGLSIEDLIAYFGGADSTGGQAENGEGLADSEGDWPLDMEVSLPVDSEEEAVALVLQDPVVLDFYLTAPNAQIEVTDEGSFYLVHVFEVVMHSATEGHNATCGWYSVDKQTGVVDNYIL